MRRKWQGIFLLVAFLGILTVVGCAARFFQPAFREPELPVQPFLLKQNDVLPLGWTLGRVNVWTDTDFTWAGWAVSTGFTYKNYLDDISEEIHVFGNPFAARLILSPSPSSVNAGKGYVPRGWTYRPPHAQRFEFGCTGGDGANQPEGCSLILRYEEYVIVLSTPIAEYMTLEDLRRLLEVIDREMADFLQHSTLRPGPRKVPESLDP